jgi:hypothetical protein
MWEVLSSWAAILNVNCDEDIDGLCSGCVIKGLFVLRGKKLRFILEEGSSEGGGGKEVKNSQAI